MQSWGHGELVGSREGGAGHPGDREGDAKGQGERQREGAPGPSLSGQ